MRVMSKYEMPGDIAECQPLTIMESVPSHREMLMEIPSLLCRRLSACLLRPGLVQVMHNHGAGAEVSLGSPQQVNNIERQVYDSERAYTSPGSTLVPCPPSLSSWYARMPVFVMVRYTVKKAVLSATSRTLPPCTAPPSFCR